MMDNKEDYVNIEKLWKSDSSNLDSIDSLSNEAIIEATRMQSKGISARIVKSLKKIKIVALVIVPIAVYDLYLYSDYKSLTLIIALLLILALSSFFIINWAIKSYKNISLNENSVSDNIYKKMSFYKKHLILINHVAALTYLLLTVSILLIEGFTGNGFKINNIFLFSGLLTTVYLSVFILFNFTLSSYLKQLNVVVSNFDRDLFLKTKKYLKRTKIINITILLLVVVFIIFGLYVFIESS